MTWRYQYVWLPRTPEHGEEKCSRCVGGQIAYMGHAVECLACRGTCCVKKASRSDKLDEAAHARRLEKFPDDRIKQMDEAVQVALQGIHNEMSQIREDLGGMRQDFRIHIDDDRKVWQQVDRWTGALTFFKWLLGIFLPAILAALIALIVRHG